MEKMTESKIWLSSPTMHGEEMEYIKEAYSTNWVSTVGANIDSIEAAFSERVGCKYAVALSSGTSALHLATKLAGVKQGDKVFSADVTFAASVNPVAYEKAIPVFIDSERDTWNMDPVALEQAFKRYPDTKVVTVVDLYGVPAKYDEIIRIADKYGAVVIEDAAESLGAAYKGVYTGSFGKYNVISFNGNKIITGSSGGMLLTDDKAAADRARKWSTQSRENASWYQHTELGYNYRMSNIIAGVVRGQIPHLDEHIAQKKAIYEKYKAGFADLPVTMNPINESDVISNYWLSCMLINESAMCYQRRGDTEAEYISESGKSCPTEILAALAARNAEGRPIWKPMHSQPIFKDYNFVTADGDSRTGAERAAAGVATDVGTDLFTRGLCLPSDNKMTDDDVNRVIETVRNCFK